jgi:MurNAc alpha-1-phosphate uridylyltransferase
MPDTIMLFAAGRGTRMAPLTDHMPKPMVPVAGRPLVDHALDLVTKAGIPRVFANTFYQPDGLEAHLLAQGVTPIRETVLLETGGGLKHALTRLNRDVLLTLNTDAVWTGTNPITRLIDQWDPEKMDALLCLIAPTNALGHSGAGDFTRAAEGHLARGPGFVYSGLQIIKTTRLAKITQQMFSLNLLWDMVIAQDRLFGMVHDGQWCDVGRPESISIAEDMLRV